jgi:hypothetical protein
MTTTQTESFKFHRLGTAYNGSPLWDVFSPAGEFIGSTAKSNGKRGATWIVRFQQHPSLTWMSCGGFRSREAAAQFLARQES